MSYRKERVGFRFLNLSRDAADSLRSLTGNPAIKPKHGQPDRYVLSFWLEPGISYGWIDSTIQEHRLDESEYGFFVSLVTDSDSDMIAVPDFAKNLFRRLGGRLEFSFTLVDPTDPAVGDH